MVKINKKDYKDFVEHLGNTYRLSDNLDIYIYGSNENYNIGEDIKDRVLIDSFTINYDFDWTDLYNAIREIIQYNDFENYYYSLIEIK